MIIEIDQSIKIEQTSMTTYLADSIGHCVKLNARNKKQLQHLFRQAGRPRMFVYEAFSALVAILISQSYNASNSYVIDTEYLHQDHLLRPLILKHLRSLKVSASPEQIKFATIGKKSPAHARAYFTYKRKKGYLAKNAYGQVLHVLLQ